MPEPFTYDYSYNKEYKIVRTLIYMIEFPELIIFTIRPFTPIYTAVEGL